MTEHPGEQFPPAVDPDVEPGYEPEPEEKQEPDYDAEPGPESAAWVNPTLQGRPHTDPLLAGFTVYGDVTPEPEEEEDTEQAFEASLEEPSQHSYVDDGPEDWPAEPDPKPEPATAPTPTPKPAAPAPAAPVAATPAPASEVSVAEDGVHPLVEETMARLDGLRERPVGEHAEVYADLHERLQSALVEADADHGDRG